MELVPSKGAILWCHEGSTDHLTMVAPEGPSTGRRMLRTIKEAKVRITSTLYKYRWWCLLTRVSTVSTVSRIDDKVNHRNNISDETIVLAINFIIKRVFKTFQIKSCLMIRLITGTTFLMKPLFLQLTLSSNVCSKPFKSSHV